MPSYDQQHRLHDLRKQSMKPLSHEAFVRRLDSESRLGLPREILLRLMDTEAILWDMDGTLLNSEKMHARLRREARDQMPELRHVTDKDLGLLVGIQYKSSHQYMADVVLRTNIETTKRFITLVTELEDKCNWRNELFHTDDDLKSLAHYKRLGIRQFVVTSTGREKAIEYLEHFDLRDYFEGVYGGDRSGVTNKPHPDAYESVIRDLKLKPEVVVAMEDSHIGATSAAAAGILTFYVPLGEDPGLFTPVNPLKTNSKIIQVRGHGETLRILDAIYPSHSDLYDPNNYDWYPSNAKTWSLK